MTTLQPECPFSDNGPIIQLNVEYHRVGGENGNNREYLTSLGFALWRSHIDRKLSRRLIRWGWNE